MGGGLSKVAKICGGLTVSANNQTLKYVYDYAQDKAVLESEMPQGSDRWKESERVKWSKVLRSDSKESTK
jgi:hypothetical protein